MISNRVSLRGRSMHDMYDEMTVRHLDLFDDGKVQEAYDDYCQCVKRPLGFDLWVHSMKSLIALLLEQPIPQESVEIIKQEYGIGAERYGQTRSV